MLSNQTYLVRTSESAREFIPVQHAEVSHSHGQLAVRAQAAREHQAVAGAVHGLHAPLLVLDVKCEHILLQQA